MLWPLLFFKTIGHDIDLNPNASYVLKCENNHLHLSDEFQFETNLPHGRPFSIH